MGRGRGRTDGRGREDEEGVWRGVWGGVEWVWGGKRGGRKRKGEGRDL